MKAKVIVCSLSLAAFAALTGCAGNHGPLNNSIGKTEATMAVARENSVNPTATASATAKIDSARVLKEAGEEEQAQVLLEQSELELLLAIATSERDAAKAEDQKVEADLRADVERKLLYQSILDKETNKEGAAK